MVAPVVASNPDALANMVWEDFLAGLKEAFGDIDKKILHALEFSLDHKFSAIYKILL